MQSAFVLHSWQLRSTRVDGRKSECKNAGMKWSSASLLLAAGALATTARGDADPVVLSVGKTEVRAAEIAARLAGMHEFERRSFGATDAQVKRGFLEQKLVPQALGAEQARARGFDKDPAVQKRVNEALAQALKDSIQAGVDKALTDAEVRAYCEARRAEQKRSRPAETKGAAVDCTRDHLSYRVALRREKAHAQMTELRARLKKEKLRGVDYEPLSRLELPPSVGASPKSSR
jgi:hypothetical protein